MRLLTLVTSLLIRIDRLKNLKVFASHNAQSSTHAQVTLIVRIILRVPIENVRGMGLSRTIADRITTWRASLASFQIICVIPPPLLSVSSKHPTTSAKVLRTTVFMSHATRQVKLYSFSFSALVV